MSLKVTYAGSEILNLTASAQKTLTTAGTYCEADIGINYTDASIVTPVKDGKTRLYISIPNDCDLSKLPVTIYWNQSVSNGVLVDFGDDSPVRQNSNTGNINMSHTYATGGNYVITMTQQNSCVIKLGQGGAGTGILGETNNNTSTYRGILYGMETGDGVTTLQTYCCQRSGGLKTIIFGRDITNINNSSFQGCTGLGSIRFLGPTLPANASIGATNVWAYVPEWCKVYVPSDYIDGQGNPQNVPARMPSTSTYTYAVEPNAYSAT